MAGDESGQVINLSSRTGYAPDMASLARSHVVNARERLGLTPAEFATVLEPFLDWSVSGGVIENWETTGTPPGDALLAIGIVARASPLDATGETSEDLLSQLFGKRFADVEAVFATRSEFTSQLPPTQLFAAARRIDAAGLSLNMLCQQFPDDQLRELINEGMTMRCLFLEPGSASIQSREKEEGYPLGHLSALTDMNIQILSSRVRDRLDPEARQRVQIATYDETIRFNVLVVDDTLAAVQPYLPVYRGVESPTLVLRRQESNPGLFTVFDQMLDWLWERSSLV